MNLIANEALTADQVPSRDAAWADIERFALTFDGYKAFPGALLDELVSRHHRARTVPSELTELRACLFFEQRRWRHYMAVPRGDELEFIRSLLEGIRRCVSK